MTFSIPARLHCDLALAAGLLRQLPQLADIKGNRQLDASVLTLAIKLGNGQSRAGHQRIVCMEHGAAAATE